MAPGSLWLCAVVTVKLDGDSVLGDQLPGHIGVIAKIKAMSVLVSNENRAVFIAHSSFSTSTPAPPIAYILAVANFLRIVGVKASEDKLLYYQLIDFVVG
ncbi:hypothetical protein ASV32_09395 [Enterobacter hormaechei subsp. xiangfangensis]|nr:hypothetical protein [Enterobacter hormaechei]KTH06069.1 hypothetical protein ASV32_09395 [Enterobacter hormaechei subsp. xiangfangensis]